MPVMTGKDSKGCYSRWGNSGKKYYYKCGDKKARDRAKAKAGKQGQAAHANKNMYSTGFKSGGEENNDNKSK